MAYSMMHSASLNIEEPRGAPGAQQHSRQPARPDGKVRVATKPAGEPMFQFLAAVARVEPDTTHGQRLSDLGRHESNWPALLSLAERHGVMPLVCRYLTNSGKAVVPPQILDRVRSRALQCRARGLFLTGRLLPLLDSFHSRGIRVVPFKGATLAAMLYGDVTLRESSDIDLLVWPEDVQQARQALLAAGFREGFGLSERGQQRCLGAIGQLPYVHQDGAAVDLHARVMPRDFGFAWDATAAYARRTNVVLAGRSVATFCPEDTLLILAVHGAKHLWTTLGMICDIADLVRASPSMNWELIREMAGRLHCARMVRLALVLAHEFLDAPLPQPVMDEALSDPMVPKLVEQVTRRLLRASGETPSGTESILFHFRARERLRDAARYGLSLALEPTVVDWNACELPGWLGWMYFVLRPVRLARKYSRVLARNH